MGSFYLLVLIVYPKMWGKSSKLQYKVEQITFEEKEEDGVTYVQY